jgi:hypothetical protein
MVVAPLAKAQRRLFDEKTRFENRKTLSLLGISVLKVLKKSHSKFHFFISSRKITLTVHTKYTGSGAGTKAA